MSEPANKAKSQFYWASIAGADPEPVEVSKLDGRRVAYTCGCADPFFLDEKDCPVRLGTERLSPSGTSRLLLDFKGAPTPMERPEIPDKGEAAILDQVFHRRPPAKHGWRGPR